MKIFKTDFFVILTIHNDQISYGNHVLDPLCVFFSLFGCLDGGGVLLNDQLCPLSLRGALPIGNRICGFWGGGGGYMGLAATTCVLVGA